MGKDALSANDLANLLKVTPRTLRNWERDGSGPPRHIRDLEPFYELETLVPWLRKNRPEIKIGSAAQVTDRAARLALLEAWEACLCKQYRLESTEVLYQAVAHADFHSTYQDPTRYWTIASYSAFTCAVVRQRLSPERLQNLCTDFQARRDFGLAAKKDMAAPEFAEQLDQALTEYAIEEVLEEAPVMRQVRDFVAIGFRYACCVADDFIWLDPLLPGRLTAEQMIELNDYVNFVSTKCRIPAGKPARQACQRQLDDLAKSGGVVFASYAGGIHHRGGVQRERRSGSGWIMSDNKDPGKLNP